jgi:hypothetical protein
VATGSKGISGTNPAPGRFVTRLAGCFWARLVADGAGPSDHVIQHDSAVC